MWLKNKLLDIPLRDTSEIQAESEQEHEIYTWEITVNLSGHLRTCHRTDKTLWERWFSGGKKEFCKCSELPEHYLVKDAAHELTEYLELAGVLKHTGGIKVKTDTQGRSHMLIRCSRFIAALVKNSPVVRHIIVCNDLNLVNE